MRKLINLGLCFILAMMSLSFVALPSYAQTDEDFEVTSSDDLDFEYDWDYEWDTTYGDTEDLENLVGAGLVFGGIALVIGITLSLGMYIFSSLALMNIAKRLNEENPWYAWIPILNVVLLFRMGDQNPLLILLVLIPGIGALVVGILSIIALMNICEKRGYDKLLGLLALVPVANIVLLGILAWGKKG